MKIQRSSAKRSSGVVGDRRAWNDEFHGVNRGRAGRRKSDAERVGAKKKTRRIVTVACPAVPFAASVSNAN